MDPWIWGALGALLVVIEVAAPGFFLIVPALGALVTAGAGFLGLTTLSGQIAVFAAASALIFALTYRSYRRLIARRAPPMVNSPQRLVGANCIVEDPIVEGAGKVRLGDTVWLARGPDLAKGAPAKVRRVDGTVLVVEPR